LYYVYVLLLLRLCILIRLYTRILTDKYALCRIFFANWHSPATLSEDFSFFFHSCMANARVYKVWSKSSETDFFTRLWVHFGTPLFAAWYPRTPSLPGTRDGPSAPFIPLWFSVEKSRALAPCYC